MSFHADTGQHRLKITQRLTGELVSFVVEDGRCPDIRNANGSEALPDWHRKSRFRGVVPVLQQCCVYCGTLSDGFLGFDVATWLAFANFDEHLLDTRHVGGATGEHDFVQVFSLDTRCPQHQFGRVAGSVHQVAGHSLEVAASQRQRKRFALVVDIDRRLSPGTEFAFRVLTFLSENLQRFRVFPRISAVLLGKLLGHVVDDSASKVKAAQHHVTVCLQAL